MPLKIDDDKIPNLLQLALYHQKQVDLNSTILLLKNLTSEKQCKSRPKGINKERVCAMTLPLKIEENQ